MSFKDLITKKIQSLIGIPKLSAHALAVIEPSRKNTKVIVGQMLARLNGQLPDNAPISKLEFQVFSQFGDDGIIQFLISHLPISNCTFVEFGVENYMESNTRFLLVNNNWSGFVMDGDLQNVQFIQGDELTWYHSLQAKQAFITRENVNELIATGGLLGEIGILSIDLDGVDYWVWEAITVVQPTIVIVEYNSMYGSDSYLTVPYQSDFRWKAERTPDFYWGASLGALTELAKRKGYDLFGCNTAGNNAYFIRQDRIGNLPKTDPSTAYSEGKFALGWDENSQRIRGQEGMRFVKGKQFIDVRDNREVIVQ